MIYLYCAEIPEELSLSKVAEYLQAYFDGEENRRYIEKIKNRSQTGAAEGLFSLFLLSKIIDDNFSAVRGLQPLVLARADSGKPYFIDSKLKFSISHSKGFVACALSDEGDVGVDIEASAISPDLARKMALRYFSGVDQNEVVSDPAKFAFLWTKKEATVKFFEANFSVFLKTDGGFCQKEEILIHSFQYRQKPISLCTKRDFEKIIFCDFDSK